MSAAKSLAPLAALVLSALVACSPSEKARPGTQARWESQLNWPRATLEHGGAPATAKRSGRKLAESAPKCLKDRVNDLASIKAEAARLEKLRGGTAVPGSWQSKDLSTLAPPQAQYLSAHGEWIATDGMDFTSCADLPCILNRVYGPAAELPGWKAYGFYLSMGYPISFRDYVPQTQPSWPKNDRLSRVMFDAPLSAHLFKETELTSFWKLSFLLPDTYRAFGRQSFHRVPDGTQVPSSSWSTSTCADSWGNKEKGTIRAKRCLEEDNFVRREIYEGDDHTLADTGILGQFYMTMTHELTHTWDRSKSNGKTVEGFMAQFSDTDEWVKFSGWYRSTLVDTAADPDEPVRAAGWAVRKGFEGFVRDYAGKSPAEDVAETAAWVRLRPTLVAQRSPKKAEFISGRIYGGRTYDAAGLKTYYTDSAVKALNPQLLEVVESCLTRSSATVPAGAAAIAGAAHLTLERPLPEAAVACLESELHARLGVALDQLRATEWEACDTLVSQETPIRADVFSRVSSDMGRYVAQNIDRAPMLKAVQQLRTTLALQVDPREAYVHCFRQEQPETCYQQALSDAYDRVAQPFATDLAQAMSSERAIYLEQNTYAQSQSQTQQFYKLVFAGVEPRLVAAADARWQACTAAAPSTVEPPTPPLVRPFTGGARFVAADILNCLNTGYEAELRTVRDGFISRLGLSVSDLDVQVLIQGILLPDYLEALQAKAEASALAEEAERAKRKAGVIDVLVSGLSTDSSWVGTAQGPEEAVNRCVPVASKSFDEYFARVSEGNRLPLRFASPSDVRTDWSREACTLSIAAPAVAKILAERGKKAWAASMAELEISAAARARDTATDCIARNPSRGRTVAWQIKNARRQCLTAAWSTIETQALVDWEQKPTSKFYLTRRPEAASHLSARKKVLQTAAIQALDAR